MIALRYKNNINRIELLINEKTDINQKNNNGDTVLELILKNYSEKNISLILYFFYSVNKQQVVNIIKLIINASNSKYYLEIQEFYEKDNYGWNLKNYLSWNQRRKNINYLLIFNY